MNPDVHCIFDEETGSASYLVRDVTSDKAAIIDPVLGFDPVAGRTSTTLAEQMLGRAKECSLDIEWILETHVHADHLSSASFIRERIGGRIGIGRRVAEVAQNFGEVFGMDPQVTDETSPFDVLFDDGDEFALGALRGRIIATPGHTPACLSYVIGDACFVGDTLFMPDSGTARCDFPGGDAKQLYRSIQRIFGLPDETRLFVCHDYGAGGTRPPAWETSVAAQRTDNIHVGNERTEADFVAMREARDRTLDFPRLLIPAIQINLCAGAMPAPDRNGVAYVKIPINSL